MLTTATATAAADAVRRDGTRLLARRRTYQRAPCQTTNPSILYPMRARLPLLVQDDSPAFSASVRARWALRGCGRGRRAGLPPEARMDEAGPLALESRLARILVNRFS